MARLLFLGGGKMGGAIISGLMTAGGHEIFVVDPGLPDLGLVPVFSSLERYAGPSPDALILAIKPQLMATVLPPLAERFGASLFISIAAGKTLAFFQGVFGEQARVVRAMPNLPAAIGAGITGWVGTASLSTEDRDLAQTVLGATGQVHALDEEAQIDAWTAIAGSGPAYLFHMLEALGDAAQALGFDPDLSNTLALQTVLGAAQLADQSGDSFANLRESVTSPGGTTAAGLEVLRADLPQLMLATAKAAEQRARDLA